MSCVFLTQTSQCIWILTNSQTHLHLQLQTITSNTSILTIQFDASVILEFGIVICNVQYLCGIWEPGKNRVMDKNHESQLYGTVNIKYFIHFKEGWETSNIQQKLKQ